MKYEIIDNFLPENEFKKIKDFLMQESFPWNLSPLVSNEEENLPTTASYYFVHLFWSGFYVERESEIFAPIMNKIECNSVIRIKANLYPSTEKLIHHENHVDYEYSHKSAILYLNTNNGFTILEDKIEVESIENRLLLFDGSKPHRSTTCTDDICRINVGFNYF